MTGHRGCRFTCPDQPALPRWETWADNRVSRDASAALVRGARLPDLTRAVSRESDRDALSRIVEQIEACR